MCVQSNWHPFLTRYSFIYDIRYRLICPMAIEFISHYNECSHTSGVSARAYSSRKKYRLCIYVYVYVCMYVF